MTIVERLKNVFENVTGETMGMEDFQMESNLFTDLGLNSVGILYMVVGIEEEFKVTLNNLNITDFKTVGDVVKYLEGALK